MIIGYDQDFAKEINFALKCMLQIQTYFSDPQKEKSFTQSIQSPLPIFS